MNVLLEILAVPQKKNYIRIVFKLSINLKNLIKIRVMDYREPSNITYDFITFTQKRSLVRNLTEGNIGFNVLEKPTNTLPPSLDETYLLFKSHDLAVTLQRIPKNKLFLTLSHQLGQTQNEKPTKFILKWQGVSQCKNHLILISQNMERKPSKIQNSNPDIVILFAEKR